MKSAIQRYLGVSTSVLAIICASSAYAQDAGNSEDEVVVTGFRQSLAAALDLKKNATGVVDAIVADDIADFPDLNLAESLQRVPGVAIDRQAGEGRRVTVRGLGGDFTRVRINGMEALSTTGGSDASGGTNRSRAFDFNTFNKFCSINVLKVLSIHLHLEFAPHHQQFGSAQFQYHLDLMILLQYLFDSCKISPQVQLSLQKGK